MIFESIRPKLFPILHFYTILYLQNPKFDDSYTFWSLKPKKWRQLHGIIRVKKKNILQQPAPSTWLSGLETTKVTTVLHFYTILYLRNPRFDDTYTFCKPKTRKVTTIIRNHWGKKTMLQQPAPSTWLSGLQTTKVTTVLHFYTILYLRNPRFDDS